ncbi:hypothetical protein ES692_13955 [Psychroserpens burtonensis]|uniref:Uncharacterized protein n=1 Tax=Psychroserpens burtonensis TaxID=49278 RepID=A0A5C7B4R0_9FLAO|nr:hypothetical protein [Psychroserpens burtonensis]TXE16019.1 hypothetical protein ES692_13955 [Psychroserpens burtonensis]
MIDISQIIISNITKRYIFYIPSSIYSLIESSDFKGIIPKERYDCIMYYNETGTLIDTDVEDIGLMEVISKKSILQKNLVALLESKSTLSPAAFDVILKDYVIQIESHQYVTSLMYENITTVFPNIADVLVSSFKFQAHIFNDHYTQLVSHFQLKNKATNLNNKNVLKNFRTTVSKGYLQKDIAKDNVQKSSFKNLSTPPSSGTYKMTDAEIDLFLLQTVFGVAV